MAQTIISTITVNDLTVTRANVIAQRTGSLEMGIAKAMLIEQLKQKLANGVAHFIFQKKDGTLREMFATTNPALCNRHINGKLRRNSPEQAENGTEQNADQQRHADQREREHPLPGAASEARKKGTVGNRRMKHEIVPSVRKVIAQFT